MRSRIWGSRGSMHPHQDRRQDQVRIRSQDPCRRPARQASGGCEASSISWNLTPGAANAEVDPGFSRIGSRSDEIVSRGGFEFIHGKPHRGR